MAADYLKKRNELGEANFPVYGTQNSVVEQHLTVDMYKRLHNKKTSLGGTLDQCIQPSVEFTGHDEIVGLVATDEECYTVFKELFDPVVSSWHKGFGVTDKQPASDLDAKKLTGGELDSKYVQSCRVRTGRCISGIPFAPLTTRAQRRKAEEILVSALSGIEGDYYPLPAISKEQEAMLDKEHIFFPKPRGHFMTNSNSVRDWPDARGIWHNKKRNFIVWINEEDHCRVMSMQPGGSMQEVYERFCDGLKQVETAMDKSGNKFCRNERVGIICMCPTNLGTGLRCSVHIKIPNLGKHPQFKKIVKALDMESRGTAGEFTENPDGIYDLSNAARLQKTETEFVQLVINGVNKVIELEKKLESGGSIDELIAGIKGM